MATWYVPGFKPGNKYKAQKIVDPEYGSFDSVKEFRRFRELKYMERAGEISDLQRQVTYTLLPKQVDGGRVLERAIEYVADFVYRDKNHEEVVEDVKGYKKGGAYAVFVMKRKMMLYYHGIRVKEV